MCLIATEDALSVAVVCKILEIKHVSAQNLIILPTGGFGRLKSKLGSYCQAALNGRNIFMLTDLDQAPCASKLVNSWFEGLTKPSRFLFRVAVREVETWLLADRSAFANYLGISPNLIPRNIEDLADPKQYLLSLARRSSSRKLRTELLPRDGVLATQGFGYNENLVDFVANSWSPLRASELSISLDRTLVRVEDWVSKNELV